MLADITLPAVIGAALVDSLNPCAFALLLVFVATMFAMVQRQAGDRAFEVARRWLFLRGGVYVLGIFLTYLALGFGLMGALTLAREVSGTHWVSRVAALAAIGLGLMALQEALVPELGSRLGAHVSMPRLRGLVSRLDVPGLFGAGVLVGLCTVPCSGAVYLAVLALLASQVTVAEGAAYLVLYNLVFVSPLVAILALASSRPTHRQLARWQLHYRAYLKFGTSVAAIGVGLLTLLVV